LQDDPFGLDIPLSNSGRALPAASDTVTGQQSSENLSIEMSNVDVAECQVPFLSSEDNDTRNEVVKEQPHDLSRKNSQPFKTCVRHIDVIPAKSTINSSRIRQVTESTPNKQGAVSFPNNVQCSPLSSSSHQLTRHGKSSVRPSKPENRNSQEQIKDTARGPNNDQPAIEKVHWRTVYDDFVVPQTFKYDYLRQQHASYTQERNEKQSTKTEDTLSQAKGTREDALYLEEVDGQEINADKMFSSKIPLTNITDESEIEVMGVAVTKKVSVRSAEVDSVRKGLVSSIRTDTDDVPDKMSSINKTELVEPDRSRQKKRRKSKADIEDILKADHNMQEDVGKK